MKKIIKIATFFLVFLIMLNIYVFASINSEYSLNKDLKNQISANIENYVNMDEIPKELKDSIVITEDKRFYSHFGFDIIGISRAVISNIKEDDYAEGGSTITQQLAKNLFLSNEKKLNRKLKELVLAVYLEMLYSKEEILEMYLNVIYYGEGVYGIGDASYTYFNKQTKNLTLEESAMLAGILSAPSIYNPIANPEAGKERQELVLNLLLENDLITVEDMATINN